MVILATRPPHPAAAAPRAAAPASGAGTADPWAAPYSIADAGARARRRREAGRVRRETSRAREAKPSRAPSARTGAAVERPIAAGRIRRMLRGVLLTAAAAVGLVLLLVIALPVPFGHRSLVVMSGSMEPALPTGSLIVVQRIPGSEISVGDVVSFRSPEESARVLTHRVQTVKAEGGQIAVQTRGDANTGTESWAIDPAGTVGRVAFHLPLLGYLVAPLQGVVPRLLLVVVPALLLGGLLVLDIWRPRAGRRGASTATAPAAAGGGGA